MKKLLYILLVSTIALGACKSDTAEPAEVKATPYALEVPKGFPQPRIPADNPMTEEGVELGRLLFYDPILSSNGLSCATCHVQERSFTVNTVGKQLAPNFVRNIPPFVNLAWNPDYGWAGAHERLDIVAITDFGPQFFNSNMDTVVLRLNDNNRYRDLFYKAYNGENVLTKDKVEKAVSYAIAQFIRTLISADSKYDQYKKGQQQLTDAEKRGMDIFFSEKGDCFHCHGEPLFTDNAFHNIGLEAYVFSTQNIGRFEITHNPTDKGKFSSPTLRNIELTAPYMHDGRFETLEEVIEHYNSGVKPSSTLDPLMTKNRKDEGLNLTAQEKADLKAFLLTLTDKEFTQKKEFSNPFK